jgi:hypothetical protein
LKGTNHKSLSLIFWNCNSVTIWTNPCIASQYELLKNVFIMPKQIKGSSIGDWIVNYSIAHGTLCHHAHGTQP